jgi:hypothetical protein
MSLSAGWPVSRSSVILALSSSRAGNASCIDRGKVVSLDDPQIGVEGVQEVVPDLLICALP